MLTHLVQLALRWIVSDQPLAHLERLIVLIAQSNEMVRPIRPRAALSASRLWLRAFDPPSGPHAWSTIWPAT
ncbi:hypothetical protein [Halochromatium salexigens]|uniref:Uncharacterized protein n=1 Tax=Halochromatium salexigens TaxID=49447 RepID=A0AAJ0UH78_HALSE|nr:hypothetical protein [Halochromatium salexigens]MBK5930770.1 hypothetical protein [Halochromatium salexigens]